MTLKLVLAFVISIAFCCGAIGQTNASCTLPQDLSQQIAKAYPETNVVTLASLNEDDKQLFIKDHRGDCPGLVRGDFFGDGKASIAVVLITKTPLKDSARLVVAHRDSSGWELMAVDSARNSVPVLWEQKAGEYQDVYGAKALKSIHPVIVLCEYESWAIVYAWTGKKFEKIWLSD